MPVRSKWQSLPTEAINPATLAIDKQSAADIVEEMLTEDRKMLAAVQREKDRIVGRHRHHHAGAQEGRPDYLRRRRHQRPARRPRSGRDAADLRHEARAGAGDHGRRQGRHREAEGRRRGPLRRRGARRSTGCGRRKHDVVIGVSASGMTQFVRGALTRARRAGSKIIFVTCDPRTELQTFVDLTIAPAVGPEVIAGSTRLKAGTATKIVLNMLTTGRDGPHRQDLRQPDGRRADRVREAARPRPAHHHHRHRPGVRRGRQAAAARALERQGGDRHAEVRPVPTRRR